MSQRVLTDFLLDFGKSFWGSPEMQEQFPGLLFSGLKPIGKYGIGFFSVFMIAERVLVITRRSDAAARETLVLEFSSGLQGRPILRPADRDEQLIDGGTHVRIKLQRDPLGEGGLLEIGRGDETRSLAEACALLCPGIDVDLFVKETGAERKVVDANDWTVMEGKDLLARLRFQTNVESSEEDLSDFCERAAPNLRLMRNANGDVVGRALISIGYGGPPQMLGRKSKGTEDFHGCVTVGGLRACAISGVVGVLSGRPLRASRQVAVPLVEVSTLRSWAEDQADLVPRLWLDPESQMACAQYIAMCGGRTKGLPIGFHRERWVTAEEIEEYFVSKTYVYS